MAAARPSLGTPCSSFQMQKEDAFATAPAAPFLPISPLKLPTDGSVNEQVGPLSLLPAVPFEAPCQGLPPSELIPASPSSQRSPSPMDKAAKDQEG
jgi:hypothetical protein